MDELTRDVERQRRRLDKAATFDVPVLAGGFVASVTATSPLQSSGGLTPNISFISQFPNLVLASDPVTGTTAPQFRALVAADLPVVPITKGGHGQITALAGFNALSPLTTLGDTLYRTSLNNARLAGN